jgi:hypothetical protein
VNGALVSQFAVELKLLNFAPCTSKFESDLLGQDSNFDMMHADRWVDMGERATAIRKQSGPSREGYPPVDRDRLGYVTQIRVRATCQRDEFSLFTSKFESYVPSHAVSLCLRRVPP